MEQQLLDIEQQTAWKIDLWEMGNKQSEPQDFPSLLLAVFPGHSAVSLRVFLS